VRECPGDNLVPGYYSRGSREGLVMALVRVLGPVGVVADDGLVRDFRVRATVRSASCVRVSVGGRQPDTGPAAKAGRTSLARAR
jgi:hypothetical protein